jgi:hypothetical protein
MTTQTGQLAQPELALDELEQQWPSVDTFNAVKEGVQNKLQDLEREMILNK